MWRLLRIFKEFDVKISILGVVRAMQQCPAAVKAFLEDGHEIVSHGWRWIDYHNMDEAAEREHVRLAIEGIRKLTGRPPVGWFNGRPSANTRRLLVEAGGFLYDRDALNDELPYGSPSPERGTSSSPIRWRRTTIVSIATQVSAAPTISPVT